MPDQSSSTRKEDQKNSLCLTRREVLLGLNAAGLTVGSGAILPIAALGGTPSRAASGAGREIENSWIEMPDGVKLAARIWLPPAAERRPFPAILNYCPYFAR